MAKKAKEASLAVEYVAVETLLPYKNNARAHGDADVDAVMASIKEFGFNDPIGVWKNIIVEGHGRLMAAKRLGLETVPVIRLDHLTDKQRKAYALAHNKTAELSGWDFDVLGAELADLADIDMSAFGFNEKAFDWFEDRERNDTLRQEGNDEYNAFLDKFEQKKTTDDCYTPDNVYEVIADWVAKEYNLNRKKFVRPFYPGGDYANEKYEGGVCRGRQSALFNTGRDRSILRGAEYKIFFVCTNADVVLGRHPGGVSHLRERRDHIRERCCREHRL